MIYLAAPYSDPSAAIVQQRMETIYQVIGEYMLRDIHIVTPLFMHEIVQRHDIPGDYTFWEKYCLDMLGRCDEMLVVMLPGWDTSRGVAAEIEFCMANDILVRYCPPPLVIT